MTWTKLAERIEKSILSKKRTEIRKRFSANNNVPIIEDNVNAPKLVGESGGYFTLSGNRIYFPKAYAKKGRSNMQYKRSTLEILVPFGTLTK
jgi:hypothetical protein